MTFSICTPHEGAHMPMIMHMWIADASKCAATIHHGFSVPLILSPLQGRATAPCMLPLEARPARPAHLRDIALPIAKEALLLANCCQRTNDAPAPGGLLEGPSLQSPSCLQQELDPVQRRRQRLPCRPYNTFCDDGLRPGSLLAGKKFAPWSRLGTLSSVQAISIGSLQGRTTAYRTLPSRKRWVPLCAQGRCTHSLHSYLSSRLS